MELDCTVCPSKVVAVVRGQPMEDTTFIKRVVISGFYLNDNPFLAKLSLEPPCS